ncbi:MAG: hypothetical protein ACFFBR_08780 [Promethearchaeota archaeon]
MTQLTKLQRPDINLEAMLTVVSVLLGFLFVVVIYLLEFPSEIFTIWGPAMTMYLVICYSVGLSFIIFMIDYEVSHYIANKDLSQGLDQNSDEQIRGLQRRAEKAFRRSIQMLLIFILSFGLFLVNLVGFTAAKFFAETIGQIELLIVLLFGGFGLLAIRLTVMFLSQFIFLYIFQIIFPLGTLWGPLKSITEPSLKEK